MGQAAARRKYQVAILVLQVLAQPPRAPPRPASPDSLARASAPQDGKTALDLAKSNNKPECVWLLENLKLLLDEPDLLRLPFANIEPEYGRRTCIRLAVVRFWRDAAMRHQYNINATTIGGRQPPRNLLAVN